MSSIGTRKIVVFAHHQVMLNGLAHALDNKKTGYITITGKTSTSNRGDAIQSFQTDPSIKIALISILAGNCGITLTAANLVIFAELSWTPGTIAQAEDRVHRIGQTHDIVEIEYLICKNTVDSHIWRLLKQKHETLCRLGVGKKDQMDVVTVDDVIDSSVLEEDDWDEDDFECIEAELEDLSDLEIKKDETIKEVDFGDLDFDDESSDD